MATPDRDFCPLIPRPPILPLPEPGPRAMRFFFFAAPGLSRRSVSLISRISCCRIGGAMRVPAATASLAPRGRRGSAPLLDDLDEMRDLRDHAADRGRVLEFA